MSRKIVAYGGSFNPFGNHHQEIIRWLAEQGYQSIHVVPAIDHALKPDLLPFHHRYNMAKLGVNDLVYNGRPSLPQGCLVNTSTIEMGMLVNQPGPIRTYELLQEIAKGYSPDDTIHFAIGPDILDELHKWKKVEEIKRDFGFVNIPVQSMRATKLREMIAEGIDAWHRHTPLLVRRYIEMHGLYQRNPPTIKEAYLKRLQELMTQEFSTKLERIFQLCVLFHCFLDRELQEGANPVGIEKSKKSVDQIYSAAERVSRDPSLQSNDWDALDHQIQHLEGWFTNRVNGVIPK